MKTNLLKLRRVLSATLFVLLLNVGGMTNAFAYDFSAECSTGQTLYYNITDATNHYVEVTCPGNHNWSGYTAPTGDLVLPSMVVNGNVDYQVVAIGEWAFCGCSNMTSIEIPNSVTSLGVDAFRNTGLTSIVIPNTITTLESYTFFNCSNLTTVTLPDSLEIINSSAFEGCSKLTTINIPNTVTTIGSKAFYGCSKLASIQIPNSVTTLSNELFRGCSLLANFEIPNTVTTIGNNTFYGCSNLTSIDIPTSVTSIGSDAFSCTGLTSIVIPNSITVLPNGLFTSCQSLTSVVIPNTVTEIGSSVFMRCIKLPAIDIPSSVITIGNGAFRECEKLTTVTIPNSVTTIDSNAFWDCIRLLSVEMGNSVETIGNSAFKGCEKLETINIPNTVETIGNEAFSNCKKLTEIVIPNSVISIGNSAFSGCSYLESVEIGNSVETIGVSAFSSCTRLTSIVIPNSVMSIGSSAFSGCSYLESAVIGNSVETIGQFAFSECSRLSSIVIPNYVVTIGGSAFQNCVNLTSIQLGNSVQTIGNSAFAGCSLLTSLAIPETVTSIGSNIINNCSSLEQITVIGNNLVYDSRDNCNAVIKKSTNELVVGCKTTTIPSSVVKIGWGAFYQCSGLTGIDIPNSVTTIDNYAFDKCTGLTTIEIPKFVTSIGSAAFQDCTGLTQLTVYAATPPTLGTNAFKNVTKNIPVYVREGSLSAYQTATGWNYFNNFQAMPNYDIIATSNPAEGGEVSGFGSYEAGDECTLTATPNFKYTFINWTENNEVVSTNAEYTFTVESARTLVANFEIGNITFADANVKALCVANWDTNGDGELSYAEAEAVTDLGEVFKNNSTITSFDELQYFTGLTTIGERSFYFCTELTSVNLPNGITGIDDFALAACSSLESIEIPNTVTTIGNYAFYNCTSLSSIDIPITVTSIGQSAFYNNQSVTSVEIPASVVSIGQEAFSSCKLLEQITVASGNTVYDSRNNCNAIIETSVNKLIAGCKNTVIPNTVTTIDNYAFHFCTGLTSIVIPNSVSTIGNDAFNGCSVLTSISIPNTVTSIGVRAFASCGLVDEITIETGNMVYDSRDNCNAIIETGTNKLIAGCRNTIIPPTVTIIDGGAFWGCSEMMSMEIPASVVTIDDYAFFSCSKLASIEIPNSVITIGSNAFSSCYALATVEIGSSVTSIGSNTFGWCSHLSLFTIHAETPPTLGNNTFISVPSDVTVIVPCGSLSAYQAAEGWSEFTNYQSEGDCPIVFADANVKAICVANWDTNGDGELSYAEAAAVTDLGEVFKNNTTITSFDELQYFTGLTTIGWEAFAWCHNLTSIVLPSSITSIDGGAFNDCRNLLSITIPAAVTEIGFAALTCDNLETIIVEQGNTVYDSRDNCNAVIITSSNELIRGCKNTVIPNTVVSLYDHAFASCSMESINIPASVTNISTSAFYLCGNLATITVDANNVVYDSRNNSNAIIQTNTNKLVAGSKTTVIPNTVTAIGEYAFSNRFSIGSFGVTIPESVTLIEQNAYLGGYGIESISVLADIPPTLQSYAFAYVDKTIPVNVPCGTRSAYQAAEGWSEFTNIIVDPECGRQITASVNPANTGSVTGAGSYDVGDICTLTATPESGYRFVNWTENNEVVSTNSTYQFTVNANRDLVANFEEYVVTNHWTPESANYPDNMGLTGVVIIDGVEQRTDMLEVGVFCGTECRGSNMPTYFQPIDRYIVMLTIYGNTGDNLTFKLYDHNTEQELELISPTVVTFNTDGYGTPIVPYELSFYSTVSITATVTPAGAGTVTGAGEYFPGDNCTLIATANVGYQFKNWTLNDVEVSTNTEYSFTVGEAAEYVANFHYAHTRALVSGWNWYSTYIELNGIDGLTMLENSLGDAGIRIQGRNGYTEQFEYQGTTIWYGTLNSINNEQMYKVRTNAACNVVMIGDAASAANHPITINKGWNWIGFPISQSVSVENALSGFTPEADDIIKGRNGYSTYISYPGYTMWYGTLNNLEPGQGYMYKSNSNTAKTLTFQTGSKGDVTANITPEDNIFIPESSEFSDNMLITAVVDLNGEELRSTDYELAAIVNGECRGSVKLMYVEPLDRFVAFLTVFGETAEDINFILTDGTETRWSNNKMVYSSDATIGTLSAPETISFGVLGMDDNEQMHAVVYPNPSSNVFNVMCEGINRVEVVNIYGQVVYSNEMKADNVRIDLGEYSTGTYMLRIYTDNGIISKNLIKN